MDIEQHKENLKKYIEEDMAFREPLLLISDFDRYCYNHCKDIEAVLAEINKLNNVIDRMAKCMYECDQGCCDSGGIYLGEKGYHFSDTESPEKIKEYFMNMKEDK